MNREPLYQVNVVAKKDFYYKISYSEPTRVIKTGERTFIDFRSGTMMGSWLLNCDGVLVPFSYGVLIDYFEKCN